MTVSIDLRQVVYALADALDLVGVDETAHGKRVGYMAFKCAEMMGKDKQGRERLFHIGMLHDCGVSSTEEHTHLVEEMVWEGADAHSAIGATLLESFSYFHDYAQVVRYHHTPWESLVECDVDPEIARDANLIFMVDRVDALSAVHYGKDLLQQTGNIRKAIQEYAGTLFSPDLVDLFVQVSHSEAFWMMLEPPHLQRFLFDMERFTTPQPVSFDKLKQLARIFATIVDAKSHFTFEHSVGVSRLARHLAERSSLASDTCERIEVAGLLHDLGKLRVPDQVLDKPGPLDADDKLLLHRHSFETYQVLREIKGIEDIALWAAYHHEAPNGQGYPFRRTGEELTREARIIAVADVFQALAQDRPYRAAMALQKILEVIGEMAESGQLDADLVELVKAEPEVCLKLAVSISEEISPE
ncbi:MAG: HD domain-containing protein [Candidatus Thiodiazotropha lotti]|uniref:HD domain-containing protein n=1 Tax=Candidatus Thiodiazotropha lotti TaxID=2792787 RepID=A0A9E4K6D9_9GAMM|nr:HD domain-containing protein [Candidatus Thiodiazotropha lotti]ODC01404.1 phosphodiesterase [Candidatus Thiodiazotropha endoloripes]MCG7920531.1 HD domain-containing protein [Candidatus Thiodiazotropha lotti]MCG7940147.1 HD domain-containing protein [Candidatus Thiodiazotropha lotti]MCG8003102.1 HD domain-containing protein [Candidatus Thiodiazotropha lotti]